MCTFSKCDNVVTMWYNVMGFFIGIDEVLYIQVLTMHTYIDVIPDM